MQNRDQGQPQVELFDTSLRDGLQQPDLEISVPNAVMLLQRMAGSACIMPRSVSPELISSS